MTTSPPPERNLVRQKQSTCRRIYLPSETSRPMRHLRFPSPRTPFGSILNFISREPADCTTEESDGSPFPRERPVALGTCETARHRAAIYTAADFGKLTRGSFLALQSVGEPSVGGPTISPRLSAASSWRRGSGSFLGDGTRRQQTREETYHGSKYGQNCVTLHSVRCASLQFCGYSQAENPCAKNENERKRHNNNEPKAACRARIRGGQPLNHLRL